MPTPNEKVVDGVMRQGNVIYVYDTGGKHSYPQKGNTAGVPVWGVSNTAGTITALLGDVNGILGQRIALTFYPGRSALGSGMVLSGTRTSSGTVTTGGTAAQTYWGPTITYQPLEIGKIEGVSTGGIITGQITIGLIASAATTDAKVTAVIGNNPLGTTGIVCLALSGTVIALGATTEVFKTYDIPHLITAASCNAVPMDFTIGVQSSLAGTSAIARIMESSYIEFDIIPGT